MGQRRSTERYAEKSQLIVSLMEEQPNRDFRMLSSENTNETVNGVADNFSWRQNNFMKTAPYLLCFNFTGIIRNSVANVS